MMGRTSRSSSRSRAHASGEPITAEETFAAGMATEVTEPGETLSAAIRLAERIAEDAPLAFAEMRALKWTGT